MITLHHCPQTRSMRTLWLLHELDVEFREILFENEEECFFVVLLLYDRRKFSACCQYKGPTNPFRRSRRDS